MPFHIPDCEECGKVGEADNHVLDFGWICDECNTEYEKFCDDDEIHQRDIEDEIVGAL